MSTVTRPRYQRQNLPEEIEAAMQRARALEAQRRAARAVAQRYNGTLRTWAREVIALDIPIHRPMLHRVAGGAA